jgi:hypothetical protein
MRGSGGPPGENGLGDGVAATCMFADFQNQVWEGNFPLVF